MYYCQHTNMALNVQMKWKCLNENSNQLFLGGGGVIFHQIKCTECMYAFYYLLSVCNVHVKILLFNKHMQSKNEKTNRLTITKKKKKQNKTKQKICKKSFLPNRAFNSHGPFYCTDLSCDDMSEGCA